MKYGSELIQSCNYVGHTHNPFSAKSNLNVLFAQFYTYTSEITIQFLEQLSMQIILKTWTLKLEYYHCVIFTFYGRNK
jgi:hypothetical protein